VELLPSLRASDSDRERVADRLRHATSEGRLTADELEERLDALYAARTYGELDALVADLPVPRSQGPPAVTRRRVLAASAVTLVLGVLGMLALAGGRSGAVTVVPGRHGSPGLFVGPHHGLIVAASTAGALVVLGLMCAVLVWAVMRSRSSHAH
jgi:hypothetical protein